jgi:hypothetical protein
VFLLGRRPCHYPPSNIHSVADSSTPDYQLFRARPGQCARAGLGVSSDRASCGRAAAWGRCGAGKTVPGPGHVSAASRLPGRRCSHLSIKHQHALRAHVALLQGRQWTDLPSEGEVAWCCGVMVVSRTTRPLDRTRRSPGVGNGKRLTSLGLAAWTSRRRTLRRAFLSASIVSTRRNARQRRSAGRARLALSLGTTSVGQPEFPDGP